MNLWGNETPGTPKSLKIRENFLVFAWKKKKKKKSQTYSFNHLGERTSQNVY